MSEAKDWALPPELRPDPQSLAYDLAAAMRSLVLLRAEVADDAFTANVLGTQRLGHGVLVPVAGRTLVLTIGYLVTEAHGIWLTSHSGRAVQGHALASDYASGLALVMPLSPLDGGPMGLATRLPEPGEDLVMAGHGQLAHTLACRLLARQEFAGHWEYLLEDALYTAPAYPLWSGCGLVGPEGTLMGIGSLLTQSRAPGSSEPLQANLSVPVAPMAGLLERLAATGSTGAPHRPWLGVFSSEEDEGVQVTGLVTRGPAHAAGVSLGDVVRAVGGAPVATLADFYRALWAQGEAGATIALDVQRGSERIALRVRSAARESHLKQPQRH